MKPGETENEGHDGGCEGGGVPDDAVLVDDLCKALAALGRALIETKEGDPSPTIEVRGWNER